MAKIRRIARQVHRGQLFTGGELLEAHLERAARRVAELGGGLHAIQAAWLYAAPGAGVAVGQLLARGVAARAARIVECLQPRPREFPAGLSERLLGDRQAALVRYAVLTDWYEHLAGQHRYEYQREQHVRLADALGLARPAAKPAAPVENLAELAQLRLGDGEHWGPIARRLQATGDPAALPVLLSAYHQLTGGQPQQCCLQAVRAAIHAMATAPSNMDTVEVRQLAQQWWDSTDPWQERVAVQSVAVRRDSADHKALLSKIGASPLSSAADAAIAGLTGPGDAEEIAALHQIVVLPQPQGRWARQAAARRLIRIGGPDAQAALDDRHLSPADPPWREDPDWLRRNGTRMIPTLIGFLDDRYWQLEAPYALGELRAREAVGPLCDAMAQAGNHPIAHIVALGKIGAADAVPSLLDLMGQDGYRIRDQVLRALSRIGDDRVISAAITACDDPHPVVRDRAARVLARHGDQRAVPALIKLCDGRHAAIAAEALARIGDARALSALWKLFRQAPDRRTRHAAGKALARIDGRREYIHGCDVYVRRAYTWLLGHKPQWHPAHTLNGALDDDDALVRAHAIAALARLGNPAAAEQIKNRLADPDGRVRASAATALGRLGATHLHDELAARQNDTDRFARPRQQPCADSPNP